jgi:hypothetical protein
MLVVETQREKCVSGLVKLWPGAGWKSFGPDCGVDWQGACIILPAWCSIEDIRTSSCPE